MNRSTLHLHTQFVIDRVDPRIFGGFLEHMGRAVNDGVYRPQSAHADDEGFRTDVMDAMRELRYTAMRYPGGNFVSGYHWQDGVGPREHRPTTRDLAWQSLENNHVGTNEFMSLCRKMDWTPMMAVNLGTGTPEEARNWLEYTNIAGGSKWADLRREHGVEQPHNIRLWCLGNEMDGPWQIGHVPAEDYAIKAQQTARMMRMVDPNIELVACGSCAIDLPTFLDWDRKVLEHCRDEVDYLSLHRYVGNPSGDTAEYLAVGNSIDWQIEATYAVCVAAKNTKRTRKQIKLSFDEWNVWYRANSGHHVDGNGKFAPPLIEERYNLEDALVAAGFLNSFIRHADSVKIANIAQIVNVIAPILTREDEMFRQTIFYPFAMMSKRRDGVALRTAVDGPTYETKAYGTAREIDASAILDGTSLKVFLVNRTDAPAEVAVCVGDASVVELVDGELLTGADAKAENDFDAPDRVTARPYAEVTVRDGVAILALPPLSFFAGTLRLAV